MSRAAVSVFVFALYLLGLGAALVIAPNPILSVFGLPPTEEVWIRIAGTLALVLAFYYFLMARADLRQFMRWTVYARSAVMVFFTAFVLLGYVKPILILFGVIDVVGSVWTALALRSERQSSAVKS